MSNYDPPKETLPIFDPAVFATGDEPLTYNIAVKKFLKYPSAQGTENLQAINVNGISTFNAASNFNEPIRMTNIANPKRQIFSSNYSFLSSSDKDLTVGTIYNSSADFYYDNDNNNGTHIFRNKNGAGTQSTPLRINSTSVEMNSPLAMTSATAVNRTIQTTNLNVTNTSNTSVGIISGSAGSIVYDNNVDSGNHQFRTQVGGVEKTVLILDSSAVTATSPFIMSNTISNNRNVSTSILSIQDLSASANPPITGSITTASTNISYTNNNNSGAHNFVVKDGSAIVQTPLTLNSNGLIMNTSGNYIQFPDGTQQTTAAISAPLKTYTDYIPAASPNLPSKTVTIPAGCYMIDIQAISGGGLAGTNVGTFNGGSGGGGQVISNTSKIAVSPGQQIIIYFATSAGNNFIRGENVNNSVLIRSPGSNELANTITASIQVTGVLTSFTNVIGTMKNGLNGGNATSVSHGTAAGAGTDFPDFNAWACNWTSFKTTAGFAGGPTTVTAGAPRGSKWLLQGYGMGGVSTNIAPSTQAGVALVMITYYIG